MIKEYHDLYEDLPLFFCKSLSLSKNGIFKYSTQYDKIFDAILNLQRRKQKTIKKLFLFLQILFPVYKGPRYAFIQRVWRINAVKN